MATVNPTRATADDLMATEGKAELIGGRVIQLMASGIRPNEVAGNIFLSLRAHARPRGAKAFTDNIGYIVRELTDGRESFSPDASYYDGPLPANLMKFVDGPPTFAAEVRSEHGYTLSALREIVEKRADYFEAGTKVVWDVDPIAETIDCYLFTAPNQPIRFARGQMAHAEPAVPGWRIAVDEVFA